jgi:hypothetical protein
LRPLLAFIAIATLSLLTAVPAAALTANVEAEATPGDGEGIGIRLVDIPAVTQKDPRARSYIVDNLPPGTTINRRVEVHNHTSEPQDVRVYPGAARIENGAFVPQPGGSDNELTTWISVDQPTLHLQPDESAMVMVTVDVPTDSPPGEQYAAVWAEVRSARDSKTNIVNASRVGVRMYISVGAGNGPAPDFSISGITASRSDQGKPEVRAKISNTGGRALDVSGTLSLADGPSGLSAGPFPTTRVLTLAPGTSGDVLITLGAEFPNGPWQAAVHLKSGLIEHEATAQVTFPAPGKSLVTLQRKQGIPTWLMVTGSVALVVLLMLVVLVTIRRLRRAAPHRAHANLLQGRDAKPRDPSG